MKSAEPGIMKNYAAVDIGSNSFHLKIAAFSDGRISDALLDKRIVHRLAAKDQSGTTYIPEERIVRGIEIIGEFASDIAKFNAVYMGMATSAVRESVNGYDFLKRVKEVTGLTVEIISGYKEAELIYEGAMLFFSKEEKDITVVDIGGGSTEIIKGRGTEYLYAESMPVGAVRCSQMFAPDFNYSEESIYKIGEYTREQLVHHFPVKERYKSSVVIGTSGTFNSLATLRTILTPAEIDITFELIRKTGALCSEYNEVSRRMSLTYIEKNKLEILPASIAIVKAIADYFAFAEFIYSPYAIREGMIQELIRKETTHG